MLHSYLLLSCTELCWWNPLYRYFGIAFFKQKQRRSWKFWYNAWTCKVPSYHVSPQRCTKPYFWPPWRLAVSFGLVPIYDQQRLHTYGSGWCHYIWVNIKPIFSLSILLTKDSECCTMDDIPYYSHISCANASWGLRRISLSNVSTKRCNFS